MKQCFAERRGGGAWQTRLSIRPSRHRRYFCSFFAQPPVLRATEEGHLSRSRTAVIEICWTEQERIAKLEAPTPPGSPKDGAEEAISSEVGLNEEQKKLLQAAVDFLREPQVQSAPMSAKINYLHQKLKLGAAGIKVAVGMVYGRACFRSSIARLL